MEEVRQLVQEEGREARNLVAFHVSVDTPARVTSRPPLWSGRHRSGVTRLRSASAGRDKRSELRARYWALLFADLQRAVGEIYNTVEQHENLSECQEVILVLENYTRDFKALCEWFRLKWEYDNTPPPQRPRSLAWEIRKTDFVRPEVRKSSVRSSPSVSGKNSPCFSGHNTPSGKNSPNLSTGKVSPASGKISPRISSVTSPKGNVEFFSSKVNSKVTTKPEPKAPKDIPRLSDIKEKVDLDAKGDDTNRVDANDDSKTTALVINVDLTKKTSPISPKQVIMKASKAIDDEIAKHARATIEKLNVMECAFLEKQLIENAIRNENMLNQDRAKDLEIIAEKLDSKVKGDKIESLDDSPIKSEDNFADVSSDSSPKSTDDTKESVLNKTSEPSNKHSDSKLDKTLKDKDVKSIGTSTADFDKDKTSHLESSNECENNKSEDTKESQTDPKKEDTKKVEPKPVNKPAYSQAAAKPKIVSAVAKVDAKVPVKTVQLARSRTVVEIRPNTAPKLQKFYPKRSPTSKCSYPFNLTTGRTSLFDAHSNRSGTKKPLTKSASALNESKTKIEVKKPPPKRPSTLKVNEKGDKKEKLLKLDNLKDCDEYSSSETVVTQIDMSRIESSESLMTLVAEDGVIHDVTNSIEVLNVDGSKNDNEGWLTVKSRRLSRESKKQSKSHWSNRFNQPSATTSLPTLNMVESPKQEHKPVLSESKFDRAKSEQPQIERKIEKTVKVVMKIKEKSKNTSIIRQKSDVTGLKTRSARNKALAKKEKNKDAKRHLDGCELVKNRLHSSLESLTGLARSQESTEDAFDFDKWKSEFKSTFKYLDDDDHISGNQDFLKTADPTEMSEIAQMTSQIEENERKISLALDFQSEVDQRKLSEEEDLLNRQIMELQQVSDVDIDTETDDTETDAEIHCDDTRPPLPIQCPSPEPLGPLAASLEDQYESALAGMSWAERVDTLGVLEALVARDPGRAQQLHAKLSQGIKRRGSLQDALRRLQAKQSRAERHRLELQTERTKRIQVLLARVEEVKVAKNQLIDEKRLRMERRLQKAAENRDQHIKDIVRKAHDEEEKLREILFIKQLSAENRRHEFLEQCRSHTYRLREMRRDRLDKLEQKAAREAAVGARRLALEEARRLHVSTLVEKRKERDARREEMREMRRQERDDANREKAENVKSRLEALAHAAELEVCALRSRIEDKHIATRLRLETHLQAIRSRATLPRVITTSESHDHLKEECEQDNEMEIAAQDKKDRDKLKLVKKKARKLRQKMLLAGQEYEEISLSEIPQPLTSNSKIAKVLIQINNVLNSLQNQAENKNDTRPLQNGIENNNSQSKNDNSQNKNDKSQNKNDNSQNKNVICQKENTYERKKSKRNRKASSEEKQLNINKSVDNSKESTPDIIKNDTFTEQCNKKSDIDIEKCNTKLDIDIEQCNTNSDIDKTLNAKNENDINKNENDINKNNKSETSSGKKSKSNRKKRENSRNSDSSDMYHSKNDNDKLKLIKTPSVTSSMSDMSKISAKSDKKYTNIDWMYFEKIINELNRSVDKMDEKSSKDIPVFGIRTITQLLAYAVDRDDTSIQVSAKCITTSIQLITRLTSRCAIAATSFIHTNCCLHVAKILASQMEKDQDFDKTEVQLLKSAIDCLHHAIDSVVYTTKLYDQAKHRQQTLDKERLLLSSLRSRAFGLVSYVCISGCLSRQELPDDVTEDLHALVTVCARICLPCDVDTGNERQCAMTSLRLSLTSSLCGARAALCSLLAVPRDVCNVHMLCALLSALAEMDYKFIQESFGSGRWPLEFRAVVAHLLTLHAPSDRDAPPCGGQGKEDVQLSENITLNLIVLIGYILVNNPLLQETICDNWTAIKTLCNLPANWIVSTHRHKLLPTLAVLAQHVPAALTIAKEMCLEMIEEYVESPEAQNEKLVQLIKDGRKKVNKKTT